MFKKICNLKNFGIFRDSPWGENSQDLAKFNLIYCWNRGGKTTFSRIFAACEKRTTDFTGYPRSARFEIKMKDEPSVDQSNCRDMVHHVRVFNRDFVEENVFFSASEEKDAGARPIVYVSQKDIKSARTLQKLQDKIPLLKEEYQKSERTWVEENKKIDRFRTRTAKRIKDEVGIKPDSRYRNYDKRNIEEILSEKRIEHFLRLSLADEEGTKNLIQSTRPQLLECLSEYSFDLQYENRTLHGFSMISEEISALLARNVVSETIERLKDDAEINSWVERGFRLHKDKNEKEKCLFCQSELRTDFLESLSMHFSDDYENLQQSIKCFIDRLKNLQKTPILQENQNLSAELQNEYKDKVGVLNTTLGEVNGWLDEVVKALEEKCDNPLHVMEPIVCPQDFDRQCNKAIQDINSVFEKHNSKSRNHLERVQEAEEKLVRHIIAENIEEEGYQSIVSNLASSEKKKNQAQKELDDVQKELKELERKTSDIGGAVTEINRYLEEFFGRKDIELELDSRNKGYVLKRNGERALNLSEGEKNAIAFSYFIVKTREKDFDIKEGTIVIDDPVSSFDSNFTYHCFSLIKNNFNIVKQLILLTHNFEFFNLVKNQWFCQKNERYNRNQCPKEQKKPPCEFFMIKNGIIDDQRYAQVVPLDETLRKFNSEYHFLFSELKQFYEEPMDNYANFYRIGNMARRFLETYLNFKIPTTDHLRNKLDQIYSENISNTERDKLYRLLNEFSHMRDGMVS